MGTNGGEELTEDMVLSQLSILSMKMERNEILRVEDLSTEYLFTKHFTKAQLFSFHLTSFLSSFSSNMLFPG